ncbi:PAS domain S-box protein [Halosegnis sp.]|uniref:PAS domain S-box protein n=1 Tax=Halosegnis sp. TaxID=2864959 RepID=UPI0035D3F110
MSPPARHSQLPTEAYETLFHNASDGLLLHPPESDAIVDANERIAEMLGYSRAELLELTVPDITAPDWDPPVSATERVQQAREDGPVTFEWRDRRKDGSEFWAEINLSVVRLSGEPYVLSSVRDISERKEEQRRAEAIFDQTYQFTGLLNPDGTVIEANRTALEFGGLDREAVVGRKLWDCYWFQTDAETRRGIKGAVRRAAGGESVRYEVEIQGEAGTELLDFAIRPVTDERGEVTLLVPEGRVITERRERRQRLDVYNRVLRHNLRNRLAVIIGSAREITRHTTQPRVDDLSGRIVDASDQLVSLADDIRAFDRLKRGETMFERVDVAALVERVTDRLADQHDTSVRTTTDAAPTIQSNPRFLETAVEQLVENALVHAAPPVEVTTRVVGGVAETVAIRVRDHGPGIPDREAVPLTDATPSQVEHPSGIGLWLAKWSVDELGGELRHQSDEVGTAVTIEVPVKE